PPARGSVPGVPGPVQTFVQESAALTGASRIEVVDVSDRARLTAEAIAAGELIDLGDGTSYARSHSQDVARTEERTRVLTRDPADAGEYNRWGHTDEYRPMVVDAMRGESQGQVMYVAPYLMSPPGTPLEKPAIGVELTDDRIVTLNAFTMFRTGDVAREALGDGSVFERGLHVAGDLNAIRRGNPTIGFSDEVDQRRFYTIPDDREMLHYGSAYGGNALLGKIGHGLRQASYDAHKGFGLGGVRWLAEQMGLMEIVIEDAATGQELERYGAVVAAPSGSGKTNLVMLDKVLEVELDGRPVRVRVNLLGDDISWIWEGPDGQLRAFNPENGVFGIAPGTNGRTNASAMAAIGPGSGTIFTNVGINEEQRRVFWEGLEPADRDWVEWVDDEHTVGYPKDITGWRDWQGKLIRERPVEQQRNPAYPWAHPNSRFTTSLTNFPNLSPRWNSSDGIPIHMVILGGRSQTDPLIREARDLAEGVYEGFVMGVEATAAAEGKAGEFREDPMSMRPFFGPDEEAYLENWLDVMGRAEAKGKAPNFFRVNWFRKDKDGKFIWPGYGDNLRALLWAIERIKGQGKFVETPVGNVPTPDAIHREGSTITEDQIAQLTSLDPEALSWDVERRGKHLDKFPLRPEPIRQAHERVVVEEGLWQIGITADAAVEDETADTVRSVKAPRRSR
ncbi:MAG: phosphoenolpyruvate carboxykinase (GTP), partial [Candidatus Omnitrophota bacterium]|nr:phosphoenolpyruvate carboxykinase (GTP) [Candidatus Omnitrophota bacterium]